MEGFMYILKCVNGNYYTGSTINLQRRLQQHQMGEGANFTKKHLPVELVYFEKFQRIDEAFYREKQVQGWSRKKKEALISGEYERLSELSKSTIQLGTSASLVPNISTSSSPDTLISPVSNISVSSLSKSDTF